MKMNNLILIGFMGTGKSTVGKAVAETIGVPHLDVDAEIERETGRSIPELFQTHGEAFFRDWETKVLRNVLNEKGRVISTGGGAVLRKENREVMLENGMVIALTASPEEIVRRIGSDSSRPLVMGDIRQRVQELMAERQGMYDFAHCVVDTQRNSLDEVVKKIISVWIEQRPDRKD